MRRRETGGVRSVVGPGLVAVSLGILVGAALLSPGEPVQYAMAQTNPAPAVKPVLDTSGLKEIQSIPVGKLRDYPLRETIDELGLKGYIPLELIVESIANLAIMQMGLAEFVKFDPDAGAVILEGDFGRVLTEILGIDPARDFGLTVEHTDFSQIPGVTPKGDKDRYKFTINRRQIEVILLRDFGDSQQGYDWGVGGLLLRQYSEKEFAPNGLPRVEEKELAISRDKITGECFAYYTLRIIKDDDGKLLKWKQWKFVKGNTNPVWTDGWGF